jgi:hypothetical protein
MTGATGRKEQKALSNSNWIRSFLEHQSGMSRFPVFLTDQLPMGSPKTPTHRIWIGVLALSHWIDWKFN